MRYKVFLRLVFITSLVSFVSDLLLAQVPAPISSGFSRQVSGQVRYAGSHQPADQVLVRIESFSGGLVGEVTTDRTGKFSFYGLSSIQYVVTVHAPGYLDDRRDVNMATQATDYLNFELIVDKNSVAKSSNDGSLAVVNANIPLGAQSEYSKGKALVSEKKEDKLKEAVVHLEKAVTIFPDYLDAQILLGLTYMDLKDWAKAEKALQSAIKIEPRASTAYFALGEAYISEKKYAEAQDILSQGLKANEASAEGHLTLAKALWEKAPTDMDEQLFRADAEKAWKEVSRSIQLDPKLADAHLLAGNMLLRARRGPDALAHFEEYLKLKPDGEFAAQTRALIQKLKDSLAKQAKSS